jgi:hypothetical protein
MGDEKGKGKRQKAEGWEVFSCSPLSVFRPFSALRSLFSAPLLLFLLPPSTDESPGNSGNSGLLEFWKSAHENTLPAVGSIDPSHGNGNLEDG